MINVTLLWMLLVPVLLSAVSIYLLPKITGSRVPNLHSLLFAGLGLLISSVLLALAFYLGVGAKTADIEIWNGEIVDKARSHGAYKRPYDCNCRSVERCSGSGKNRSCTTDRVCDTCWEDRYTATWQCRSNIGNWTIQHLDESSRSVYNTPDPMRYTIIQKGDPVSRTNSYTNYIKAAPETLFRPTQETLKAQFANQLPAYPINVYDFYRVDRVLGVGVSIPNVREWNTKLSEVLKKLGPAKQANAIIVITKSENPNYFYALQDAWLNGKKNDIVLVIGAPEFPKKAAWVNIMALTQDNIFQVKLRDEIMALEELTPDTVIPTLNKVAMETFKRKRMRDFQYLEGEIDPPEWVMITTISLIFLAYLGFWFFMYKTNQVSSSYGSVYNRNKFTRSSGPR